MGRDYIGDRYNSRPILNLESTGKPQPCRSTYQEFLAAHIVSIFGISSMLVSEVSFGNTVEPPRKGHFGTNINSSGLSPL